MCRELKKCFDEYNITYLSLTDHALLCSEMKQSKIKEIEEKLGIDLDQLTHKEKLSLSVLYSRYVRRAGREEALKRIYLYAQRRLQNPGKDLRNGRVKRYEGSVNVNLPDQSSAQTESMESILATSGALLSKFPISLVEIEAQEF